MRTRPVARRYARATSAARISGFEPAVVPVVRAADRADGVAEGEGFEPSRDLTAPTGFQDRRIQPLCHPSGTGPASLAGRWALGCRAMRAVQIQELNGPASVKLVDVDEPGPQ